MYSSYSIQRIEWKEIPAFETTYPTWYLCDPNRNFPEKLFGKHGLVRMVVFSTSAEKKIFRNSGIQYTLIVNVQKKI